MATQTKTWVFASDAEGLSQQVGGGQAPTFAFEGTDGNSAGSVKFTQGTKSQTNSVCEAYNGSTGDTFSSLFGIGAGDSVSSVRVTAFDDRVVSNTKLTSHSIQVILIDDAGSTIAALCTVNPGTTTGAWAAVGAQSPQSISKSGSDGCRLKLIYTCTTSGGGGSASVDYRMDNIAVEITYASGVNLTPGVGSIILAGFVALVSTPVNVNAGVGALNLAGFAPTVTITNNINVSPGAGALDLTGFAPTVAVTENVNVSPGTGDIQIEGFAPVVSVSDNQNVQPGFGEFILSGFASTVSTGANVEVLPGTGVASLSGFAPTLAISDNKNVQPDVGALSLAGFAPTIAVSNNQTVSPGVGALTLAGFSPTVTVSDHREVTPGTGVLTLTGFAPGIAVGGPQEVLPGLGVLTLVGLAPSVEVGGDFTAGITTADDLEAIMVFSPPGLGGVIT